MKQSFLLILLIFTTMTGKTQNRIIKTNDLYKDAIRVYGDTLRLMNKDTFYFGDLNHYADVIIDKYQADAPLIISYSMIESLSSKNAITVCVPQPIRIDSLYLIVPITKFFVKTNKRKRQTNCVNIESFFAYYTYDFIRKGWGFSKCKIDAL